MPLMIIQALNHDEVCPSFAGPFCHRNAKLTETVGPSAIALTPLTAKAFNTGGKFVTPFFL
jgi:hypothetical protein